MQLHSWYSFLLCQLLLFVWNFPACRPSFGAFSELGHDFVLEIGELSRKAHSLVQVSQDTLGQHTRQAHLLWGCRLVAPRALGFEGANALEVLSSNRHAQGVVLVFGHEGTGFAFGAPATLWAVAVRCADKAAVRWAGLPVRAALCSIVDFDDALGVCKGSLWLVLRASPRVVAFRGAQDALKQGCVGFARLARRLSIASRHTPDEARKGKQKRG
mmetsp:Transcript_21491/g.50018  ORF Transcript_21491/g.50018 Transcript_21491/m.50018 type:complete len:215 (+) Transcript_21491:231-875(+)